MRRQDEQFAGWIDVSGRQKWIKWVEGNPRYIVDPPAPYWLHRLPKNLGSASKDTSDEAEK